ncbi:MAG: dihydroorotate dehydrogenase electron transfer subunit [Bacteroidales bacterium]|nr:dihydroorotate dehydrogenase electron transfer subunit [Bacteroidales bacterium]
MQKIVENHEVIETVHLNENSYVLRLKSPVEIPEIHPGNFAEIQVPDTMGVFLRRPFSILDVNYKNREISFYIKAIGSGTQKLGELQPGMQVNLIYPLGNRYTIPQGLKRALIVGGGTGIAPFILLGKELKEKGIETTFLIGGRTSKDILLTDKFSEYGTIEVTTEDGSMGEKGFVTSHSLFNRNDFPFEYVYTCGPDAMMKAVGHLVTQKGVVCEASLENMMACGYGICLCCVTPTVEGNKRVCYEGPVFNVSYLKWQN